MIEKQYYYIIDSLSSHYAEINKIVLSEGKEVSPRNNKTLEIRPCHFIYNKPINRCLFVKYRDINPFFLVTEVLWILSGRESVYPLNLFNTRIASFSDNGIYFNAPYGLRLRNYGRSYKGNIIYSKKRYENDKLYYENEEQPIDQLRQIYELLRKDPDSRRAVASIWSVFDDLNKDTKDVPCNDLLFFKIRDNKLDLTVSNRSNDLHFGVPTNLFQFSFILEIMAYCLGVEVGKLYHNTDSLHIYLSNPISSNILGKKAESYDFADPYIVKDVLPSKFSLKQDYLNKNINIDIYDKVFTAIEEAMLFIENLDNLKILIKDKVVGDNEEKYKEIFYQNYFEDFLYKMVESKSDYLSSLLNFVSSYYFYKIGYKYLKNEEINLGKFFLYCSFETFKNVNKQEDFLALGCNFLITRTVNGFNTMFKMKTTSEARKVLLDYRNMIQQFTYERFNKNIQNFVFESLNIFGGIENEQ